LASSSWKARYRKWEPEDQVANLNAPSPKIPFRDYPTALRTRVASLVEGRTNVLVISARNVSNEVNYVARIAGTVYRTARQTPLPQNWPVLSVRREPPRTMALKRLSEATSDEDYVSGLPLVVDGIAQPRSFLLSQSSDIAHSFAVDPDNRFGVPHAWLPLSEKWNSLHGLRLSGQAISDEEFAAHIDNVAATFGLSTGPDAPGNVLPHSIVAQRDDDTLHFLVVSASLGSAARFLAAEGFRNAIVLDQSGSVNYAFVDVRGEMRTLVSTSNYRSLGTCFLLVETGGHLGVARHFLIPT
jgi:hypothetical protein